MNEQNCYKEKVVFTNRVNKTPGIADNHLRGLEILDKNSPLSRLLNVT